MGSPTTSKTQETEISIKTLSQSVGVASFSPSTSTTDTTSIASPTSTRGSPSASIWWLGATWPGTPQYVISSLVTDLLLNLTWILNRLREEKKNFTKQFLLDVIIIIEHLIIR